MAVPTAITDLSTTPASNSPSGGESIGTNLDDYFRTGFAFQRQIYNGAAMAAAAAVASAATTPIGAAASPTVTITGTTTITAFDNVADGIKRDVTFSGSLTLTHNATSLILPGAANITTASGDSATFLSLGSGNWRCIKYQQASGFPYAPLASPAFTGSPTAPTQAATDKSTKLATTALVNATGRVLQAKIFYDTGSSHNGTSFINAQGALFSFTPVSANSTLHMIFSLYGQQNVLAGVNPVSSYNIYEAPGNVRTIIPMDLQASTSAGGNGVISSVTLLASVSNSALSTRQFSIYSKTSNAGVQVVASGIQAIILEVAN